MEKSIYKFQRDFLGNENIRVQKRSGDTSFAAHRHDYFEIILYRRCRGRCIVNGTLYPIEGNCLFLLTPKDYHKIEAANPQDAESVIISFSENFVDSEFSARVAFSPRVWYSVDEETMRAVDCLCESYHTHFSNRSKKLFHLLNTVLCDVLEYGEVIGRDELCISPAIAQAITVMLSDISREYTLDAISHDCGFSTSYFSSLFHKEMGKSFKAWLNDARIDHAKGLLLESELSVLEICYECGYHTPSQFIRMFKRRTGLSPSAYRREGHARMERTVE